MSTMQAFASLFFPLEFLLPVLFFALFFVRLRTAHFAHVALRCPGSVSPFHCLKKPLAKF